MENQEIFIDRISDYFSGQMVSVYFHFEGDDQIRDGFSVDRFWVIDNVFFDCVPTLFEFIIGELKEKYCCEVSFSL